MTSELKYTLTFFGILAISYLVCLVADKVEDWLRDLDKDFDQFSILLNGKKLVVAEAN